MGPLSDADESKGYVLKFLVIQFRDEILIERWSMDFCDEVQRHPRYVKMSVIDADSRDDVLDLYLDQVRQDERCRVLAELLKSIDGNRLSDVNMILGDLMDVFNLEQIEREVIVRALDACGWVQVKAAKLLGITARMLNFRVAKYGITHPGWIRNGGNGKVHTRIKGVDYV